MAIPQIFDTALQRQFQSRAFRLAAADARAGRPAADFLLTRAGADLSERLSFISRRFGHAIDIFSHTDAAAQALRQSGKVSTIERLDCSAEAVAASLFPARLATAEDLPLPPQGADLITSLLSLHSINDIPGLLIRLRRALKPDGLLLAALCGAGTLGELRESMAQAEMELYGGVSPHIAPFPEVRDCGALLQRAGFALPVADTESLTVRYDSMFALMADLRRFGAQNALTARRRRPYGRHFFCRAAEIYAERFSDADGRIRATFAFIWLSGWAPAAGQQQPMRPGSAKTSLAEALAKAERGKE